MGRASRSISAMSFGQSSIMSVLKGMALRAGRHFGVSCSRRDWIGPDVLIQSGIGRSLTWVSSQFIGTPKSDLSFGKILGNRFHSHPPMCRLFFGFGISLFLEAFCMDFGTFKFY